MRPAGSTPCLLSTPPHGDAVGTVCGAEPSNCTGGAFTRVDAPFTGAPRFAHRPLLTLLTYIDDAVEALYDLNVGVIGHGAERHERPHKPVLLLTVLDLIATGEAKLVATSRFTPDAIAFAKGKPIELVDSEAILYLLRGVQTSGRMVSLAPSREPGHLAPACPRCDSEMKVREAKRGTNAGKRFWGCSQYPACRGTRAI